MHAALGVWIYKLRQKLAPLGIGIETMRGEGWRLDAAPRERLRLRAAA